MPFDVDNPPDKLKGLSDKNKRQWIHVFNDCWNRDEDEKKCHMQAWGVVKKASRISERIARDWGRMVERMEDRRNDIVEIVEDNPEQVSKIEDCLGLKWNGNGFDVLSYPDVPGSDVDSVDNAPGGITAKVAAKWLG